MDDVANFADIVYVLDKAESSRAVSLPQVFQDLDFMRVFNWVFLRLQNLHTSCEKGMTLALSCYNQNSGDLTWIVDSLPTIIHRLDPRSKQLLILLFY